MISKSCRLFEQDHATEQALSQSCGTMAMGCLPDVEAQGGKSAPAL
jgi:hypothetical protein